MSIPVLNQVLDIDKVTNRKMEFYKCTNGMYREQKLQVHYEVSNFISLNTNGSLQSCFFTAKKKKTYSYNKRKKEFLRILRKMKNQKSINKIRPKKKTSRGRSSQVNTAVAGTSWYKQIQIPWYMYVGICYCFSRSYALQGLDIILFDVIHSKSQVKPSILHSTWSL